MKKAFLLTCSILFLISCKQNSESERIVSDSSGNINQVTVVIENPMWKGPVGEAIRNELAASVDGLPQEEPLFSLSQIPPQSFAGFVRRNRLFFRVKQGQEQRIEIVNEKYARPQTGVIITGRDTSEITELINRESDSIISLFKQVELNEKQRRISKSLKDDERLRNAFGLSLKFPTSYRYALEEENFVWIRKEIRKGLLELLIYEVPLSTIDKDTSENSVISNIIKMRDSIGEAHIPGPVEGSYMITEEAYAPYLFETEIDGKFAYETRGTWEVKNAFMAGPFVNYAIRDEKNDRYLILEGFVFSPSKGKRDNIFEIEAILKSARIR